MASYPEDIAERPEFVPRLIRHQQPGLFSELYDSFTDALQTAFHCVIHQTVFLEIHKLHAFGIAEDCL